MAQAIQSGIFGYYHVDPKLFTEFEGQSLFDIIMELSALTSLQWDDPADPLTLVLKPKQDQDEKRVNEILGLILNVMGLTESMDAEATFEIKK